MERDSGQKLAALAVDGGLSNSDICMQVREQPASEPTNAAGAKS
jgi:glycerol kinase